MVWTAVWSIMLSEAPVDLCIINIPPLSDRTLTSQIRGSQIVTFKLSSPLLQMQSTPSPFLTSAVPEKKPSRSGSVCDWPSVSLIKEPLPETLSDCSVFSVTFLWPPGRGTASCQKHCLHIKDHLLSTHSFFFTFPSLFHCLFSTLSLCLTNDEHQDEQCNSRWKALCKKVVHFLELYMHYMGL